MILRKKTRLLVLLLTIFLSYFSAIAQNTSYSYEKLWQLITNDTVAKQKKLQYLEVYYHKALLENNTLETYRALEKKTYMVSYNDAVTLLHKMKFLIEKVSNDSLKGYFLNRNTGLYYSNRYYSKALEYAVQSEAFNEGINNLYNLNSVRIDIGNIYYHTRNYKKAVIYFTQAKEYYKTKEDENHQRSYIIALYSLSKAYWQLAAINLLAATIAESQQAITQLSPKHQQLETAYVNYVKGGFSYLQNDYATAKNYFAAALPQIIQNEDFSNQHVIYLYLGKIAWQQNQKEKAVTYFTKIDQLFKQKKFLNYELREAYDYLISYYKETNQPQLQLQATENLIALNQQFEKEQQHLTNTLHYELETKKLVTSKTHLTQQLNTSKNTLFIWLILGGLLCLALVVYGFWQNKQKKQWRWQYNVLINNAEQAVVNQTIVNNAFTEEIPFEKKNVNEDATPTKLSVTELRLLQDLQLFETEKDFLKPLKLDDLAAQLNTNRNTLSKLINAYKNQNFNQYINSLRVKQLITDLKYNKHLRKLSMHALAENYGFANAKTFTAQFKTETHLTPAYFIEQLEFDDLQKAKS